MSAWNERKIARRLGGQPTAEPPEGLLDKIRGEIPEVLEELPELAPEANSNHHEVSRRRLWLAAAMVVMTLGAGFLFVHRGRVAAPGEQIADQELPTERSRDLRLGPLSAPPPQTQPKPSPETLDDLAWEGDRLDTGGVAEGRPGNEGKVTAQRLQKRREEGLMSSPVAPSEPPAAPLVRHPRARREPEPRTDASSVSVNSELRQGAQLRREAEVAAEEAPEASPEQLETFTDEVSVAAPAPRVESAPRVGAVFSPGRRENRAAERIRQRAGKGEELRKLDEAYDIPEALGYVGTGSTGSTGSTGGTAEPNDQPYGDVFFRSYGTNPFIDTEDDALSTFGLDVDTGSYGVVRRYLSDGHLPPPEAVRVEELINYVDYRDPAPREADFAVVAQGAPSPFGEGERYYLLRFALKGREIDAEERLPAVLTFVVDVSGSMAEENRLGLVKRSLGLLLDELNPEDRVGLVVYGTQGRVLLEPSRDKERVRWAIDQLHPEGATNAEEGLVLGYQIAERYYRPRGINRVILCSDGVANVGRTGPESILERIGEAAERGIELTTLGFGMGNYNDVLMEQLADRGDGRYAYLDTLDEARRVLVENLTGTLQTLAREAKVQVELNPRAVSRYRLLGYENRDIADHRFRDDTVDAGEIGVGHAVTALYEVKLRPGVEADDVLATLRLRYRQVSSGRIVETATPLVRRNLARSWEQAPPALRLASLVAELGEILKGSYWARQSEPDGVFRRLQRLVAREYPRDAEKEELVDLAAQVARLRRLAQTDER